MHTDGVFVPKSEAEARERYEELGSTAQIVVRELTKAMDFDSEEYDERVSSEVIDTAREVLFAERLAVTVGTRAEFEEWRENNDVEFELFGSENVDNVAWHAPPFGEGVAATFHDEEAAAVGTLRRQAFGRIYHDLL